MSEDHTKHLNDIVNRLKASEQRYQNLHDNIPLGVYRRTPGPEGKLLMVNPALVEMFGYDSAEELHSIPVANLYYTPEQCTPFSNKLFVDRQVIKEQLQMKRKDGSPFWISVSTTVIVDAANNAVYFDGIMEDITAQKNLEKKEALQREKLVQADKMISLGILVSGVAHEINNPNQFVVSHLSYLKKAWKDAIPILDSYMEKNGDFKLGGLRYSVARSRFQDSFTNMKEGTERISHIVDELRNYAREKPSRMEAVVDLNKVIESALSLVGSLTRQSTSAFYVTYDKQLPPFTGDYQKIEQVVINLIQNACQALTGEQREVSVLTTYNSENNEIIMQVNDTGCGIPEENLAHIRDPFFTTKRESLGGTGLGLSISDGIMRDHGGRLDFFSEPGEGTTVKMILPAQTAEA